MTYQLHGSLDPNNDVIRGVAVAIFSFRFSCLVLTSRFPDNCLLFNKT